MIVYVQRTEFASRAREINRIVSLFLHESSSAQCCPITARDHALEMHCGIAVLHFTHRCTRNAGTSI